MALKKIADAPYPCLHPEHNPPGHIVLEPGTYQHTCPACGKMSTFMVPRIICGVTSPSRALPRWKLGVS